MKKYKCEGCGKMLDETEIEPYGDSFCHVVPVHCCGGDPDKCMAYCPEAEPCGPVTLMEVTQCAQ